MSAPRPPCDVCGQSPTHKGLGCAWCDPKGYAARVEADVREIAASGQLYLWSIIGTGRDVFYPSTPDPVTAKGALGYLVEIGAEPRPAKKARAA